MVVELLVGGGRSSGSGGHNAIDGSWGGGCLGGDMLALKQK
jgi:hypothetical protein